MRPYSPGGALNALAAALTGSLPPAPSAHRLRRGLPGYLILFAPHAFAPQRRIRPSWPPQSPLSVAGLRSPRHADAHARRRPAAQGLPGGAHSAPQASRREAVIRLFPPCQGGIEGVGWPRFSEPGFSIRAGFARRETGVSREAAKTAKASPWGPPLFLCVAVYSPPRASLREILL